MANRITKVTLTRTTEPTPGDHTSYPGTELWRVEWTARRNGKNDHSRQSHYTEVAARQHVKGLLAERVHGLSIANVYSEGAT